MVEQAAGVPLAEVARRRVFEPLGMRDTGFSPDPARCAPTSKDGRPGVVHDELAGDYTTPDHQSGNAGLFSTGDDLARYCQALLRGETILRPETVRLMFRHVPDPNPAADRRALGWQVYDKLPWGPAVGHTGYTGTLVWLDPAAGRFCVLLTNRTYHGRDVNVTRLRREVLAALR